MLLKDLLNRSKDKDILEYSWINISDSFLDENYYIDWINNLKNNSYFISDLDGTFFRWMLSKETFSHFIKYIRKQNILSLNKDLFKDFLDDIFVFNELEVKAYNKEMKYSEYIDAWTFLMFKYKTLIDFDKFLIYLENSFINKEKVRPYRFSFKKMKEVLLAWNWFLFVSWAPHFALEIYIKLLKNYISKTIWEEYSNNIYWFWSYINIYSNNAVLLFWKDHKNSLICDIKKSWKIDKVIWWMWDSPRDFWISYNLEDYSEFYFVNPEERVITNFSALAKKEIKYTLIFERKDLIFEIKPENINIISI